MQEGHHGGGSIDASWMICACRGDCGHNHRSFQCACALHLDTASEAVTPPPTAHRLRPTTWRGPQLRAGAVLLVVVCDRRGCRNIHGGPPL